MCLAQSRGRPGEIAREGIFRADASPAKMQGGGGRIQDGMKNGGGYTICWNRVLGVFLTDGRQDTNSVGDALGIFFKILVLLSIDVHLFMGQREGWIYEKSREGYSSHFF